MKADLHIHSNNSFDATYSVEDIIELAKEKDIDYISITDHNSIKAYCKEYEGIKIIKGIEIDCYFNDDIVHLLGYGIDVTNEAYSELQEHYYQELNRISFKRLELIEKHYSCKLDLDKIKNSTDMDIFTNVEITKVLLSDIKDDRLIEYQTGSKSQNPIANFYWENLVIGKWGYTEIDLPNYQEVIDLIHQDGGICICAHPFVNIKKNKDSIQQLIDSSIDGFEAYCSYHDKEISNFYHQICIDNNLLFTCGSDFHGQTKPNIDLYDHHYVLDCSDWLNQILKRIKI
jgi:predicted metal-dependent phosphoesterase TrpH